MLRRFLDDDPPGSPVSYLDRLDRLDYSRIPFEALCHIASCAEGAVALQRAGALDAAPLFASVWGFTYSATFLSRTLGALVASIEGAAALRTAPLRTLLRLAVALHASITACHFSGWTGPGGEEEWCRLQDLQDDAAVPLTCDLALALAARAGEDAGAVSAADAISIATAARNISHLIARYVYGYLSMDNRSRLSHAHAPLASLAATRAVREDGAAAAAVSRAIEALTEGEEARARRNSIDLDVFRQGSVPFMRIRKECAGDLAALLLADGLPRVGVTLRATARRSTAGKAAWDLVRADRARESEPQ